MAEHADGSIIVDTEIDAQGFKAGSSELKGAIKSLNTKIQSLGPTFQKALSGNSSAIATFEAKASALESTISEIEAKMESLGSKRVPTEDYQWLTTEIQKAQQELSKLYDKQSKMEATGVKQNSRSWQSLQYDIDLAKRKIAEYEAEQAGMRANGTAFQMGSATAEYAQLESSLASAKNRLAEMQSQAEAAKNSTSRLAQIGNSIKAVFGRIGAAGKKAFTGFVNGVKSGISKLKLFSKFSDSCTGAISKLGKKLTGLGSMLKRMALRKIMMGILTAVKDGFNNLAKYSSQTNADLSTLKSALTQLKNSFTTAFAPILTVVTPALTKFIGYLSTALTYIGKLFAALTGAKTFTKATAVQEDYAASLGATGSAAEKAKKQLAGFDELNVLSDSSSDGGGGNGGSTSPSEMFEEVPIESSITDFIGRLKEAFKNGDYAGIGEIIGNGINNAVQKVNDFISWDNVGSKITAGVKGVAQCFNALVDTVNWKQIGDTLAQGFNAAINTLFLVITEFDWPGLAAGLAQSLNGLVSGIDWGKLGTTISTGLSTVISTIGSAITTFDWASLGSSIASVINNIDWEGLLNELAVAIGGLLEGSIDLILSFITDVDWGSVIGALTKGLVGVIKKIATVIGDAAPQIVDAGIELFSGLLEALPVVVGEILSALPSIIGSIVEGLVVGVVKLSVAIVDALIPFRRTAKEELEGIEKDLETKADNIVSFTDEIADAVTTLPDINKVLSDNGNTVSDINKMIGDTEEKITGIIKNAVKDNKGLRDEDLQNIRDYQQDLRELQSEKLKIYQDGIKAELIKLQLGGELTESEAAERLAALQSYCDLAKETISDSLTEEITIIENKYTAEEKISSQAYKDELAAANNHFNEQNAEIESAYNTGVKLVQESSKKWVNVDRDKWKSLMNFMSTYRNDSANHWTNMINDANAFAGNYRDVAKKYGETLRTMDTQSAQAFLSMAAETVAGGERIDSETRLIVMDIIENFNGLPDELGETGKDTLVSMVQGMTNQIPALKNASNMSTQEIVDAVYKGLGMEGANIKNYATYEALAKSMNGAKVAMDNSKASLGKSAESVGAYVADGFKKGIDDKTQGMLDSVAAMSNDMIKTMQDSLGIHSPSRETEWIGQMTMGGLFNGIKESIPKVIDSVSGVTTAIASELKSGDYSIPTITYGGAINEAVVDFNDTIVDGFTNMLERLQAIADGVTFTVPAMATGTVVPYSVSASTAGGNNVTGTIEASNEELGSVVIQAVTNATTAIVAAIEANSGTVVNLDANSIATSTIKEINRRTRAMGRSPLVNT